MHPNLLIHADKYALYMGSEVCQYDTVSQGVVTAFPDIIFTQLKEYSSILNAETMVSVQGIETETCN